MLTTYLDEEQSEEAIDKLKPCSFKYCYDEKKQKRFGLIAQDVIDVLPELVGETVPTGYDEKKFYTLDYVGLIPLMINTIKKQNRRIKELEDKVDKLIELVNV